MDNVTKNRLKDIVWNKTIGTGNDSDITDADVASVAVALGRPLDVTELKFVRLEWRNNLACMASP